MSDVVTLGDLPETFKGLKLNLTKMKAVLPDGTELDKRRFNVVFGGKLYALDPCCEKLTRSAWEAFTQTSAFRPEFVF